MIYRERTNTPYDLVRADGTITLDDAMQTGLNEFEPPELNARAKKFSSAWPTPVRARPA